MAYKLLLADDSVTIQRVIELTFADEDIKVTAVGDGQLAIDRIEADPPDIILADIGMPKHDGYDVASYVKSRPTLAHIPVVLLTGAFEPIDQARATAVGCDGVLAKPFEPQVVINRVKQLLGAETTGPSRHAAVPVPAARVAEPAVVAADVRAGDSQPARLQSSSPDLTGDLARDAMPPTDRTVDPNVSLDDYFDQLDAAFSKISSTASEASIEVPPTPQNSSVDFDWAPKPSAQTMPEPPTPAQDVTGLKQTGVGEFEWVAPERPAPVIESDNFDFSGVTGIDPDAPPVAISPDAPVQPSDLATVRPKVQQRQEQVRELAPAAPRTFAAESPSSAPIADAFAALLAAEQGESPAPRVAAAPRPAPVPVAAPRVASAPLIQPLVAPAPVASAPVAPVPVAPVPAASVPVTSAPVVITEALIEQITQRVLDRLSDKVVRDTVTEIVSRVAEKLVREEIEKIRAEKK